MRMLGFLLVLASSALMISLICYLFSMPAWVGAIFWLVSVPGLACCLVGGDKEA